MQTYTRTASGDQELQQRKLRLSARARTLLLLLESEDLQQLSRDAFTKIASPENYQELLAFGLIIDQYPQQQLIVDSTSIIKTEPQNIMIEQSSIQQPNNIENFPVETFEQNHTLNIEIPDLNFHDIKLLMQNTLKQYSGLMAKHLIIAIDQSQTPDEIRQHQTKWLTTLFESRINRSDLNTLLHTINHNLNKIEVLS